MIYIEVGHVVETAIYPVKGMAGLKTDEIITGGNYIYGDRRKFFSLVDDPGTPNILDTTKFPGLLKYHPRFTNPADPKNSEIIVRTPSGVDHHADSQALLEELSRLSKKNLAPVRQGRSGFHSMPVSLLSLGSLKHLEELVGYDIDPRRFRENVLVETNTNQPYEEDRWIGQVIKFGDRVDSAVIYVQKQDQRCATVNMHPDTTQQDPKILRAIVADNQNNLGVYCSIMRPGTIRIDDPIYSATLDFNH